LASLAVITKMSDLHLPPAAGQNQGRGAAKKRDKLATFHSTTSFALPLAAAAQ
jgi:hypothetical protein